MLGLPRPETPIELRAALALVLPAPLDQAGLIPPLLARRAGGASEALRPDWLTCTWREACWGRTARPSWVPRPVATSSTRIQSVGRCWDWGRLCSTLGWVAIRASLAGRSPPRGRALGAGLFPPVLPPPVAWPPPLRPAAGAPPRSAGWPPSGRAPPVVPPRARLAGTAVLPPGPVTPPPPRATVLPPCGSGWYGGRTS